MKKQFVILLFLQLFSLALGQENGHKEYLWSEVLNANPDTVYSISFTKEKLTSVPADLAIFKNLKLLNLSKNKLSALPDFLADFKQLEHIDISKNEFDIFPLVLTRIPSLVTIIANRNSFDRLPESIGYNQQLEFIDLWDSPVLNFPESFFELPHLKKVDLSGIRYSPAFQEKLKNRLPNAIIVLDAPCDCME